MIKGNRGGEGEEKRENQEARYLTSLGIADSRLDGLIKRTMKRMDEIPRRGGWIYCAY